MFAHERLIVDVADDNDDDDDCGWILICADQDNIYFGLCGWARKGCFGTYRLKKGLHVLY